jgi:bifunctional non-homologous end joining protein LigD
MQRFPDGIGAGGFFQKHIPDHFPDWIARADLPKQGGSVTHVVANDAASLAYLASQACITPHLALARVGRPDHPDRLVIDLDPSDHDFAKVQAVASLIRAALDRRAVPSFVQTTGSRGLHILVPLDGSAPFDRVRRWARDFAEEIAAHAPELATTEQRKPNRGNRVFLDIGRNAYGQTSVAPYALRAIDRAPVATPLRWDEALVSGMRPDRYRLDNIFRRLGQIEDPWADFFEAAGDYAS